MRPTSRVRRSRGWVWGTAVLLMVGAALPLLPEPDWRFWKTGYVAYLVALLVVPALLLRRERAGTLWMRHIVLLVSLALFGFLQWACPRPTGSVELVVSNLSSGEPLLNFGLKLSVLLGLTLIYGRYFCGWLCPKGTLQDLVYRPDLGWTVPPAVDRVLKWGKYASLIGLLASPLLWDLRLFKHIGPFKVLFNLDGSMAAVVWLAIVLAASVFIQRAWCRYLCPIGGLLGLISWLSPTKMRVAEDLCVGCTRCSSACPVGAIHAERGSAPEIASRECIACKACEAACPTDCLILSPSTLSPDRGTES